MPKIPFKLNTLDKAISVFAPQKALKRAYARHTMSLLGGGYNGASKKRTFGKGWNSTDGDADTTDLKDLPTLRNRSRDLYRNAPIAHGVLDTSATNVVGAGLMQSCDIDEDALGISEKEAETWETNTQREFKLWAESHDCDASRTSNFYELQYIAYLTMLVGGDILALFPYIKRDDNPYGLTVKLLEGDHLCNPKDAKDTTHIAGGIQVDKHGAPHIYHILKSHPGSAAKKKEWIKVRAYGIHGRRNIIHMYKKTRPGQKRGIPELAPIVESLKQLTNYTEAELTAAVVSGMFTVFIKQENGDMGDGIVENGEVQEDYEYALGNGAIVGLAPGESIDSVNPGRPNANFAPFEEAIIRHIGASLQIPYEMILKHFTSSYSASRAAMNEAWKYFKVKRASMVDNFCDPIYALWLDEAVSIGRIDAAGYFDNPLVRKAWRGSVWNGPVPGQLNEVQETKAAEKRIELNLSNTEREARQINGTDHRTNIKKNSRTKKMVEKYLPEDDIENKNKGNKNA